MQDNKEKSHFEIEVKGKTVFAHYRKEGNALSVLHMETPPELGGQGWAGKLMQEIADYAKAKNLKIIPICPYAVAWLQQHKQ